MVVWECRKRSERYLVSRNRNYILTPHRKAWYSICMPPNYAGLRPQIPGKLYKLNHTRWAFGRKQLNKVEISETLKGKIEKYLLRSHNRKVLSREHETSMLSFNAANWRHANKRYIIFQFFLKLGRNREDGGGWKVDQETLLAKYLVQYN